MAVFIVSFYFLQLYQTIFRRQIDSFFILQVVKQVVVIGQVVKGDNSVQLGIDSVIYWLLAKIDSMNFDAFVGKRASLYFIGDVNIVIFNEIL